MRNGLQLNRWLSSIVYDVLDVLWSMIILSMLLFNDILHLNVPLL